MPRKHLIMRKRREILRALFFRRGSRHGPEKEIRRLIGKKSIFFLLLHGRKGGKRIKEKSSIAKKKKKKKKTATSLTYGSEKERKPEGVEGQRVYLPWSVEPKKKRSRRSSFPFCRKEEGEEMRGSGGTLTSPDSARSEEKGLRQ